MDFSNELEIWIPPLEGAVKGAVAGAESRSTPWNAENDLTEIT